MLSFSYSYAAQPEWTVSPSGYQYSMQVYANAEVDGELLNSSGDMLAAFCGEECCGVVTASYNSVLKKHMFFLVVYSNVSDEDITFKVYDSSEDNVLTLLPILDFELNASVGTSVEPYVFSDVEKISGQEMEVVGNTITSGVGALVANLKCYSNGNALEAVFSLSDGFGDNAVFQINGDSLCLGTLWNNESQSEYTVQILATSALGNYTAEHTFSIDIANTLLSNLEKKGFGLCPNPATNFVIIDIPIGGRAVFYSLSGRELMNTVITEFNQKVDISALSAGAYLVKSDESVAKLIVH